MNDHRFSKKERLSYFVGRCLPLLLLGSSMAAAAEPFEYIRYRHEAFRHLEFDVLRDWKPVQNDKEVVFTNSTYDLPQLFFQTVGKGSEFSDVSSFLAFLDALEPDEEYQSVSHTLIDGFPAMRLENPEVGAPEIYVFRLIVDVGEGILYFYLKAPTVGAATYRPILRQVERSLEFQ